MLAHRLGDPFIDPSFCLGNQPSLSSTPDDLVEALSQEVFSFVQLQ